jgi:pimeloyl-ACP methyl ester carboxylesterase
LSAPGRWVLLRGLTREAGHWGDFPGRLAAATGQEVLTPDLPGCGVRHREQAPASVPGLLVAVRRSLAADGPLWLLGLSLGGMIVHEWLRQHPGEVAGAVVINTSLGGISAPWRRLRPAAVVAVLEAALTQDHLRRERRIYSLASAGADGEAVATGWAALAGAHPARRSTALRQIFAAATYRAAPPPAPPPVLVLTSAGDRMVDPRCSRAIAGRTRGAELREHPTAGHDLPLDAPDWVAGEIVAWRRRHGTEL